MVYQTDVHALRSLTYLSCQKVVFPARTDIAGRMIMAKHNGRGPLYQCFAKDTTHIDCRCPYASGANLHLIYQFGSLVEQ